MRNGESYNRSRRLLLIALLCTLAFLWIGGHLGHMLTQWIIPPFLPYSISDVVSINQLSEGTPPPCPDFGAVLIISPERIEEILHEAAPVTRWLPPGIVHDRVILHGVIHKQALKAPIATDIPLIIAVDRNIGRRPRLICRVPADVVTRLFREHLEDDLASEEDYLFGDYRIIYRPTFETFDLHSVEDYVPEPVVHRRFAFDASGDMRIKFDDDNLRITTDGRVRRFRGIIDVRVIYDHNGYGFWYDVDIQNLRLDINNMQEMLDRASSEKLERALEKSMDRRKSKLKLFKKRVPHWIPVDLALDFQLTPN